jgi:hypothetical protein
MVARPRRLVLLALASALFLPLTHCSDDGPIRFFRCAARLVVPELVEVEVASVRWKRRWEKQRQSSATAAVDPKDTWKYGSKQGEVNERGTKKNLVEVDVWESTDVSVEVTTEDGSEPRKPDDLEELDGKLYRWRVTDEVTFRLRGPEDETYELVITEFSLGMKPEFVQACSTGASCLLELDDRNRPLRIWPKDQAP